MKQSTASAEVLQKVFNLTDEEKYLLLESSVGEGIFFAGLKHVAIKIIASYTEDQIITSDPSQVLAIKKAREDLQKESMMDVEARQREISNVTTFQKEASEEKQEINTEQADFGIPPTEPTPEQVMETPKLEENKKQILETNNIQDKDIEELEALFNEI